MRVFKGVAFAAHSTSLRAALSMVECAAILAVFCVPARGTTAKDEAKMLASQYAQGDAAAKKQALDALVLLGDAALPQLQKIVDDNARKLKTAYGPSQYLPAENACSEAIDAISRVGTEKAMDVLTKEAKGEIAYAQKLSVIGLARIGKPALPRLVQLNKETELTRRSLMGPPERLRDVLPERNPTFVAVEAGHAISQIQDPAAVKDLGALLDGPLAVEALPPLTRMKAAGYEAQALKLFNIELTNGGRADLRAKAFLYLLAVNEKAYLPLLQTKLDALDADVKRLAREQRNADREGINPDTRLNGADGIQLAFEIGGHPAAVGPCIRLLKSRVWDLADRDNYAPSAEIAEYALMVLGMSHSAEAKPVLLAMLNETVRTHSIFGYSWSAADPELWAVSDRGEGITLGAVSAVALSETGDESVIPAIQAAEAAAKNDQTMKEVYAQAIANLKRRAEKDHR